MIKRENYTVQIYPAAAGVKLIYFTISAVARPTSVDVVKRTVIAFNIENWTEDGVTKTCAIPITAIVDAVLRPFDGIEFSPDLIETCSGHHGTLEQVTARWLDNYLVGWDAQKLLEDEKEAADAVIAEKERAAMVAAAGAWDVRSPRPADETVGRGPADE